MVAKLAFHFLRLLPSQRDQVESDRIDKTQLRGHDPYRLQLGLCHVSALQHSWRQTRKTIKLVLPILYERIAFRQQAVTTPFGDLHA